MGDTQPAEQQPADDVQQAGAAPVPPEPQQPATQDQDDTGVKPDNMFNG